MLSASSSSQTSLMNMFMNLYVVQCESTLCLSSFGSVSVCSIKNTQHTTINCIDILHLSAQYCHLVVELLMTHMCLHVNVFMII